MAGFDPFKMWRESRVSDKSDCDVKFQMAGEGGPHFISAHKHVLAVVSPVFKQQFFGPLKHTDSSSPSSEITLGQKCEFVKIQDFSAKSFADFLDIIYGDQELLANAGFEHLFELLRLSDKYQVEGLTTLILKVLATRRISTQCVFQVLRTVEEHKHLLNFEPVCEELGRSCAECVHEEVTSLKDVYNLWLGQQDQPELLNLLFRHLVAISKPNKMEEKMAKVDLMGWTKVKEAEIALLKRRIETLKTRMELNIPCCNCGRNIDSCQDGKQLEVRTDLRAGTRLKESTGGRTGIIIKTVVHQDCNAKPDRNSGRVWYLDNEDIKEYDDLSVLMYACKYTAGQ